MSSKSIPDEDLFLEEVAGVRPLDRRERVPVRAPAAARSPQDPDEEVRRALDDLVSGAGALDVSDTDEYVEGAARDADRLLVKKLRRGDLAVEGHLDLHGRSVDEAREATVKFLLASRRAGKRVVLVVHGRGRHSEGGVPVLKQKLVQWLGRSGLSRHVLAFSSARGSDGGAGAVYVLLR
jgi:DNA-nicking Smr family endonuclease